LAATLDHDPATFSEGDALAPLWHQGHRTRKS
jgi:hypothetical protein